MKKTVTVSFDDEKLSALKMYLEQKGLTVEGELAEEAKLFVYEVEAADIGIMPQQRFAFRFGEEMDPGLREALFQQMEQGRCEQDVAKLSLLADEDTPGLEVAEVFHSIP